MKSISVIIVLFNSQHLLDKIIDNVNSKIIEAGEVILVENSKHELIISAITNIPIIKIYPGSNLGYGRAINLAVTKASFPLFLILNPDLEILEFNLKNYSPESLFLASGLNINFPCGHEFPSLFNDTLRLTITRLHRIEIFRNIFDIHHININKQIQNVGWFSGSLILTNKRTLEKLKGFDESFFLFYEETDLCRRARENSIPVFIDCNIKYSHTLVDSSSVIDVTELKLKSELHSFFHYHSKYNNKIIITFSKIFLFLFAILTYFSLRFLSLIIHGRILDKRTRLFKTYISFFLAR